MLCPHVSCVPFFCFHYGFSCMIVELWGVNLIGILSLIVMPNMCFMKKT